MAIQPSPESTPKSTSAYDYDRQPRSIPFEGFDPDAARQKVEATIRWGITEAPISAAKPVEPASEITGKNQYGGEKTIPFSIDGVRYGTQALDGLPYVAGKTNKNS